MRTFRFACGVTCNNLNEQLKIYANAMLAST